MRRVMGALPALVLTLACSADTDAPLKACTLIGCVDGLTVDLEPASGWPAGSYRFTIDADATRVTCSGSLPLPSCAAGRALTCDTPGVVTITESGCALPAGAQGFPQIGFDSKLQPRRVVINITRNDALIGRAELAPEFRTSEPNGPGCPPTCHQAHAQMTARF